MPLAADREPPPEPGASDDGPIDDTGAGLADSPARRLRHDLSGPLVTARGFADELSAARRRALQWLDRLPDEVDEAVLAGLRFEIDQEMDDCLNHIEVSLARLDEQIVDI